MAILAKISTDSEDTDRWVSLRAMLAKTSDQLFAHAFESFCDCFFVFYSLWTLTWIVSYLANLSFSTIAPIFCLLLPASVLALAFKGRATGQWTSIAAGRARQEILSVLFFVIAGILLTLFLHRPDADDEQYLGMAFSLLAHADQPIQQLPGYGSGLYESAFSTINAYEPLKAMMSYLTGLPLLDSYYLLVPA